MNLARKYTVTKQGNHELYDFKDKNKNGERIIAEIGHYDYEGQPYEVPYLWYKNGTTKEIMQSFITVRTYVYDDQGNCYERYNPTVKKNSNHLDFDWILENTEENREKILKEIIRRAFM